MNIPQISKKFDTLPECPPILLRTEFFNSAVLIPLVDINNEVHLMLQKRANGIRQPGEICFPGGKFDVGADKTYLETAIRETVEETGISRNYIKIFRQLGILLNPAGLAVEAFIGEIANFNSDDLTPAPDEVERIFLVPLKFFIDNPPEEYSVRIQILSKFNDKDGNEIELLPVTRLGLPESYNNPWRGTTQRVLYYKTSNGPVWGITAEIIYQFITRLKLAKNYKTVKK